MEDSLGNIEWLIYLRLIYLVQLRQTRTPVLNFSKKHASNFNLASIPCSDIVDSHGVPWKIRVNKATRKKRNYVEYSASKCGMLALIMKFGFFTISRFSDGLSNMTNCEQNVKKMIFAWVLSAYLKGIRIFYMWVMVFVIQHTLKTYT